MVGVGELKNNQKPSSHVFAFAVYTLNSTCERQSGELRHPGKRVMAFEASRD